MQATPVKYLALVASLLLLLLFLGQGWTCVRTYAQTYDEAAYLAAGYSHLARRDFRLMPEHPPLSKELCALPVYLVHRLPFEPDPELWEHAEKWRIGRSFLYGSSVPAAELLTLARLPNLLLGALLAALVGWWAYRLWGVGAGLLGLALAVLDPNLVAHASVATTDMPLTLFLFLAFYLLWEYACHPSLAILAGAGGATGLALASKFSAISAVLSMGLVVAGYVAAGGAMPLPWSRHAAMAGRPRRLRQAAATLCLLLAAAALVLLAVYFGQGFGHWLSGLRWQVLRRGAGQPAYLLGEVSSEGWLSYFAVAFAVKTPLGSLVLVLASLLLGRWGEPLRAREALFLLVPPLVLFVTTSLTRVDLGLRYILPVYPFLYVCAARLATLSLRPAWLLPAALAGILAGNAVSVLRIAPQQLAYFNELAGGPEGGHRYLSDSNIDWGQDLQGVKDYMDREGLPSIYLSYFGTAPPEAYGIVYQGVPPGFVAEPALLPRDVLAVSLVNLHGIYARYPDGLAWLTTRTPRARIGYSLLVYDLDADAHWQLARLYERTGYRTLAVAELRKVLALDPEHEQARRVLQHLAAGASER